MLDSEPADVLTVIGPRPRAVTRAAQLMLTGAAIALVSLIVLWLNLDEFRRLLHDATPPPSEASVDTAVRITLIGYVVFLVGFPLLTRHVTQGRNWARLATWVLCGLGVVASLSRLGRHQPTPTRVLDLAGLAADVLVFALLLTRPSGRFFRRTSAPVGRAVQ